MSFTSAQPQLSASASRGEKTPTKEIYTYNAPWPVYGLDWSERPGEQGFRLAVGSILEQYANKLQIIQLADASSESYSQYQKNDFLLVAEGEHQYPITKVLWKPYKGGSSTPDLLATTGDYLRLWELTEEVSNHSNTVGAPSIQKQKLNQKAHLANTKADLCAPLTSFDWNDVDPSLVVTSSIDTTCTVWNVETQQAKTQLIAHDKEVYDVAFASGSADAFASVGADGSVRMFDLRSLEHSTIIYETSTTPATGNLAPNSSSSETAPSQTSAPVLRLAFNRLDTNYLATFHMDSSDVQILDVRVPGVPVTELRGHGANVNCVGWAPHSSGHVCSGGDDSQVLVWDLHQMSCGKYIQDPILAYNAESEVNQLAWSPVFTEWVAVGFGKSVQALRV